MKLEKLTVLPIRTLKGAEKTTSPATRSRAPGSSTASPASAPARIEHYRTALESIAKQDSRDASGFAKHVAAEALLTAKPR